MKRDFGRSRSAGFRPGAFGKSALSRWVGDRRSDGTGISKREALQRVSVITTPEAEDVVAELLSVVLSRSAVAFFDCESGLSTVTVYLYRKLDSPGKLREEISIGLAQIKSCGLKIGPGRIVISKLRQEDWTESWKRHFKPIEIGDALLIKPSWSERKPRGGRVVVVLDPGLSFGTGHHPTTAFCLREIVWSADSHVRANSQYENKARIPIPTGARGPGGPRSFLDLGTGSGILAIAAAKLGYSPVRALDFDTAAVGVARANARANRVQHKLKTRRGDVSKLPMCPRQERQRHDLVCANLISDLLIAERRRIAAQLNLGGTLVLAGILKSEFGRVRRAYESLGLKLVSSRSENEWRSGSFRPAGRNF
jgi:ribosomal protein L11 methyltransferase